MASEIADAFAQVAADRRDCIAIFGLGGLPARTFGEIAAGARAMRQALVAAGLPAAPCVVTAAGNDPAFFSVLLAVLGMDGAVVLFDAGDRLDTLLGVGRQLGAHGLSVGADVSVPAGLDVAALPDRARLIALDPSPDARWRHDGRRGPALLKMTSGSSGDPRAVVAAERHLIGDARHIVDGMGIGAADVNLGVIPLAHSYGLGNLVMPLLLQGSPIALRPAFSPRHLAGDIAASGATVLPGVPFMYEHLRRHDLAASLAGLRLLITAGAPVGAETVAFFKQAAGLKLHSFYGSSETGGITYDDSDDVASSVTVGRPLPGVSVALRGETAGEGRVFVRSGAVAAGYAWSDADDISAFVDDGFLTGDLGRVEDGALYLTGRVTRFINVAGRKVDPREVERVLRESPDVVDVHVFGMACDRRGEQVVACVRRAGTGVRTGDLRAFCAARLPAWKVPRQIVDVDALPRDARGKVSRGALEQLIAHTRPRGE